MKNILTHCLAGALLISLGSCKKDETGIDKTQDCLSTNKSVKTVTNATGTVYYNASTQEYTISVPQPGTIDVVDIGVVCGTMPAVVQANGTKVLVSGTFKEYGQAAPQPLPAGYTYYYLAVSNVSIK